MTSPSRRPALPLLALAIAGATSLWLSAGASADAERGAAGNAAGQATTVAASGITLKDAAVSLPSSDRMYPAGPHADVINNNCLTCHSAGMVLTQPQLSRAEWQGEVTKMVKVYKAPVAPEDAALIVDYLAQLKPAQ